MSTERSLATIRHLLEMTESRGCTQAEAAVARAKAFSLMDTHGISLKDLVSQPFTNSTAARTAPVPQPQASRRPAARQEPWTGGATKTTSATRYRKAFFRQIAAFLVFAVVFVTTEVSLKTPGVKIGRQTVVSPAAYVSQPLPAPERTYQQRLPDGQWCKFTVLGEKVVGIPNFQKAPWPNIPVWQESLTR
jgi:hypothetical protein